MNQYVMVTFLMHMSRHIIKKELDIYMRVPSGMQVSQDTLQKHGVSSSKDLA